ncbi:hypothetical protein B0H16DRAFT_1474698 [Mycena metata]|uniref:Uncharacterized protein n=1 Tax=Mycena metata TaxID=1033252 RepID=A0AAD7HFS8_9AGAR|nr:hypothetical protein B0H16DRAFT_1474698 [Mycena metata]
MTSSLFELAIKDDLEIIPSFSFPTTDLRRNGRGPSANSDFFGTTGHYRCCSEGPCLWSATEYYMAPIEESGFADVPTNAQHALRCVRHLVLGNTGVNVDGFQITAPIIRRHLEESGFTNSMINNLLDPADPQDTARALSLLMTMQNLGNPAPGSTPRFCATREALRNLGSLRFELGGTQE